MSMIALDMRDLDDCELDTVGGGPSIGGAIIVGLIIVAAETVAVPFIKGMYEGFTDDK